MSDESAAVRNCLLSLPDIAAWQIEELPTPQLLATLPAIQRGAVWAPRQTEALWDSILRGFPVGSLLSVAFDSDRGDRALAYGRGAAKASRHVHLLDGQQRANAIALGFLDVWKPASGKSGQSPRAALWVDLSPGEIGSDNEFLFRLCTAWHPWGYRRNGESLGIADRRRAIDAFRTRNRLSPDDVRLAAGRVDVSLTWPLEANAPVPVAFLIDALRAKGDPWTSLQAAMARLPYWDEDEKWMLNVRTMLTNRKDELQHLADRMRHAVGLTDPCSYRIPILDTTGMTRPAGTGKTDPIETMFIRVNSGGTALVGEELNYSILKSINPFFEGLVDDLSLRLTTPARLVALMTRVILARDLKEQMPQTPPARQFRSFFQDKGSSFGADFSKALMEESRPMKRLFDAACDLLIAPDDADESDKRLSRDQAAEIFRNSPDVALLLLVWLERYLEQARMQDLTDNQRQRLLGIVTGVAWFATDKARCVKLLWPRLADPLKFLRGKPLTACFRNAPDKWDVPPMFALFEPATVRAAVEAGLNLRDGGDDWWDRKMVNLSRGASGRWDAVINWAEQSAGCQGKDAAQAMWSAFLDHLWSQRGLVYYAQRRWLTRWFAFFDRTSVHAIEETDVPWDVDHIHPLKYVKRQKAVAAVKEMQNCIGNLRVWPMELNRQDGETHAVIKLDFNGERDWPDRFNVRSTADILAASSVSEEERDFWDQAYPGPTAPVGYLGQAKYSGYEKPLLRAICTRWIRLYEEWYDGLKIGVL
ncbi:DUF262 domain-containing protein [Lacibacterium aquatile]|uniref:DUF262 domain-containing protein n=1 Tax=Lacibacterium aquatile TaxID=1168082 RepID=A0ABW5DVR7_9PROT